jgi:hypothetical protein
MQSLHPAYLFGAHSLITDKYGNSVTTDAFGNRITTDVVKLTVKKVNF